MVDSGIALLGSVECFSTTPRFWSSAPVLSLRRWTVGQIPMGRSRLFGTSLRVTQFAELCRNFESARWKMADQAMIRRLENTALQFDDLTNQLADPEVSNPSNRLALACSLQLPVAIVTDCCCFLACKRHAGDASTHQEAGVSRGSTIVQPADARQACDENEQEITTCYNEWKSMSKELEGAKTMFAEVRRLPKSPRACCRKALAV